MKKLIVIAAALIFATPVFAADAWKMTGVMAVYPGIVNQPFSAPIVNDREYASKIDCDKAVKKIANSHPIVVAINNGNMLPPEKTQGGHVAVAAACINQAE